MSETDIFSIGQVVRFIPANKHVEDWGIIHGFKTNDLLVVLDIRKGVPAHYVFHSPLLNTRPSVISKHLKPVRTE